MSNGERKFVSVVIRQPSMDLMMIPLDHLNKRLLDKAARHIAQELIQGGVVRMEPSPTDYTEFRVDLEVMPVSEHNTVVSSLNTQLVAATDHVSMLQKQLEEAKRKIKVAKGALA